MPSDQCTNYVDALIRVVEFNGRLGDRVVTGRDGVSRRTGALLAGFHAHAHALAETTIPLWADEVLIVAARPLARSLFETGVLAQWVSLDFDAGAAVVAAYSESQRKLADNFKLARRLSTLAPGVEANRPQVESPKRGVASSFRNVTDQFEDGDEVYAYYRLLCGHTHAGVEVADQWLELADDGRAFSVRSAPRPQNAMLVSVALMGLLMASSAFEDNTTTADGPNVSEFLDLGIGRGRSHPIPTVEAAASVGVARHDGPAAVRDTSGPERGWPMSRR